MLHFVDVTLSVYMQLRLVFILLLLIANAHYVFRPNWPSVCGSIHDAIISDYTASNDRMIQWIMFGKTRERDVLDPVCFEGAVAEENCEHSYHKNLIFNCI
jgi:hypothetical protein